MAVFCKEGIDDVSINQQDQISAQVAVVVGFNTTRYNFLIQLLKSLSDF